MNCAAMAKRDALNDVFGCLDIEISRRTDGDAAEVSSGLLARRDDGVHDIAGLKATDEFYAGAVGARKAEGVGQNALVLTAAGGGDG